MSFKKELDAWKKDNNMHGPKAMDRFIMMNFLWRLTDVSKDFAFKGGNLLWFYIQTPRPTVDIDFITLVETDAEAVMERVRLACESKELGLSFSVISHKVIAENGKIGLGITIGYKTEEGANNKFGVDIVLGVPTDIQQIKIRGGTINAASMENIVVEKVMASQSFGAGNTRMKDYDDLLRISVVADTLDCKKLVILAKARNVRLNFNYKWISENTTESWKRYIKSYKDHALPTELHDAFRQINDFLDLVKSRG